MSNKKPIPVTLQQYRERIHYWVSPRRVVVVRYRTFHLFAYVDEGCWLRIIDDYNGMCEAREVRHGLTAKQAFEMAWRECLKANGKGACYED